MATTNVLLAEATDFLVAVMPHFFRQIALDGGGENSYPSRLSHQT